MLNILTGRSGPGGAAHLFSLVKAGIGRGMRQLILTPSDRSHRAERMLLSYCGSSAAMMAEVSTFDRTAAGITELCGCKVPLLNEGGRILTMYRAVKNCHTGLRYFKRLPSSVSALTSLLEFTESMNISGTEPEELLKVADELSPRLCDLALISAEYRRLCLSGAADPSDILEIAARADGAEEYFDGEDCFLWGFDGFTARELEIIRLMLRRCDVTVLMEVSEGKHLCARQIRSISALERLCDSIGVPVKNDNTDRDMPSPFEKAALWALGVSGERPEANIEMYTAETAAEECELAAALCRKYSLEGIRLREMAVICGSPEKYAGELEAAFAKYGVPVYSGSKKPILGFPPAAALPGAMDAVISGYETSKVLAWLKSGLSGLDPTETEDVENYVFTWNINGRRWTSPWKQPPEGYRAVETDPAALERLENLRKKATAPLQLLEKLCKKAQTGAEMAKAVEKYTEETGYEAALENMAGELALSGMEREASLYAQIYKNITECLEQAGLLLGEEKTNLRDFASLFRLMLSQYGILTIPQSVDCVGFGGPATPAEGVKVVIAIGCSEGVLPIPPKKNPIIPESDLIALEGHGIGLANMIEDALASQRDLFKGISAPSEKLVLIRPLSDGKGGVSHRAAFFGRLESINGTKKAHDALEKLRFISPIPAFEAACRYDAPEYLEMYPEEAERLRELDARIASPWLPITDRAKIAGLYGEEPNLSDSRLTDLANCPLSFFLKHGLKASPREQAVFGPAEIGTFIHNVVESSVKELCTEGGDPVDAVEKYAAEFAGKYLPGFEDKGRRFAWLYERLKDNASVIISDVMEEIGSSAFKPSHYELGFGDGLELPAVRVTTPEGTVKLRGRIDRLDMAEQDGILYFKVSDYKTGRKEFDISDMTMGLNLQLFIYLEAVRAGAEKIFGRKALPAAALYIPARAAFSSYGRSDSDDVRQRKGVFRNDLDVSEELETLSGSFYPSRNKKGFYKVDGATLELLSSAVKKSICRSAAGLTGAEAAPIVFSPGSSSCDLCDFAEVCRVLPESVRQRRFEKLSATQFFEKLGREEI